MQVVGLDGFEAAWVAVVLEDGRFRHAELVASLAEACERFAAAERLAVDVPIGLPQLGERRAADVTARRFVERRRSSVFPTPSAAALEAATYAEARRIDPRLSAQSYALRAKILEASVAGPSDPRIIEVHPEVTFRALHGRPLPFAKRSWNGLLLRRRLLGGVGIAVPDDAGAGGRAAADDVLDAAAAAWSAHRAARGDARSLPDPPEIGPAGRPVAIWY